MPPFDLQRHKVPLWKELDPAVNIVSVQETGSILKIGFALSNLPHSHRAYVVAVCRILGMAVHKWLLGKLKKC